MLDRRKQSSSGRTCRRYCTPLTALFTVGIVSHISYAYLGCYLPALQEVAERSGSDGVPASVVVQGVIFVFFPFFILWSLLNIVVGDPG